MIVVNVAVVVKNSEICPVVYEILEELKKKYDFE